MKLFPRSLLSRTTVTISMAMLLFTIITLSASLYFVAIPIGKRSADDLAALMILAANTWHETTTEDHDSLRQQLLQDHGLAVAAQAPELPVLGIDYPYFVFLRSALSRRTGERINILRNPGGDKVWIDIPVKGAAVRLGIDRQRISARPPIVLLLVIAGGALLALVASLAVVRRVVGPLARLSVAAGEIGSGSNPKPLSEDGPEELASLARAFNRMSKEVRELLDNRTVMVAGISHDLRTPLTRLGIAIEMLGDKDDPDLVSGIRRDLAAMENLIKQFMELARGLTEEREEEFDLQQTLVVQIADLQRVGHEVRLESSHACRFFGDPVALGRILANLLDNALHYGGSKPVEVSLQCDPEQTCIRIADRGSGIPVDQLESVFRPFHRLDTAREDRTGGSGLGLAIARQLANKNGWRVELTCRKGGGTVAALTLSIGESTYINNV